MTDALARLAFNLATEESALASLIARLGRVSTARGRDGQLPEAYAKAVDEAHLLSLRDRLRAGEWSFIAYRERLAPKSHEVPPRQISIAAARDRVPLQVMNNALMFSAQHARRQSPHRVMRRLVETAQSAGYDHVIRLDIKNFYPSVEHAAVEEELDKHVPLDAVRNIILRALRTPTIADHAPAHGGPGTRGIPQGLAISNSLAELVMHEFDAKWREDDSVHYFRYADDMIFLTQRDRHQQIYREVRKDLTPIGIEPHPYKTSKKSQWGHLSGGVEFLGYRVSPTGVSVRSSGVHRLKRSIALSFARYTTERASPDTRVQLLAPARLTWFLNLRITGCLLDKESRGWVQYYALLTDIGLLKDLDYFVQALAAANGVSGWLEQRSFVRTYRKWARRSVDTSGYIPNFDEYTDSDKRAVLENVFGVTEQRMNANGPVWVEREFARRTRLHVYSMERDLTPNY
ncbi:reverse transcriptase domain-containing protein [Microbacterium sp. NPDC055455]